MSQKWNKLELVLELIKQKQLHIRELAKLTKQPLATVSREINKLLKENVLDYQFIGKNKIVKLKKNIVARNYVYLAEHYKLIKLVKKYPQFLVILEEILKKTDEQLIILFGSYVKFNPKQDSDIDIYIETMKRTVKEKVNQINSNINVKIGRFDPSKNLIKEIIKNHVIIRGVETYYEMLKNQR